MLAAALLVSQLPGALLGLPAQAAAANDLVANTSAYDFSTHVVGVTTGSITLQFTNQSTVTLVNAPIVDQGPQSGDFASSKATCGAAIAPGATCFFFVTFHPTAVGLRTTEFFIDYPGVTSDHVAISGTGILGHITGVTMTATTAAVPGVTVTAHDPTGAVAGTTTSLATGTYDLAVPAGTYTVRFDPAPGSGYLSQYWINKTAATADRLIIDDGHVTVLGVNATLATSVTFGRVAAAHPAATDNGQCQACTAFQSATDAASPSYAAPADGTIVSWSVEGPSDVSCGCYAQLRVFRPIDGEYLVVGESPALVPIGLGLNTFTTNIRVRAGDLLGANWTDGLRWYPGNPTDNVTSVVGDPTTGSITTGVCGSPAGNLCRFDRLPGNRLNLAATLAPTPLSINGFVGDQFEAAVPDVTVQAYGAGFGPLVATTTTDANGAYSLPVPPGSYWVTFAPPAAARLARQTYYDRVSAIGASVVVVTDRDVSGISALLHPGYAASGRVTTPTGGSIAGASVQIYDGAVCCALVAETTTNADGYYTVDLAAGHDYRMRVRTPAGQERWWNDLANPGLSTQSGWDIATPFRMETTARTCADAASVTLFDNWNTGGVTGGGTPPSFTTIDNSAFCVTEIDTYHLATGAGLTGGTVTLRGPTDVGPLSATVVTTGVTAGYANWVIFPRWGSAFVQGAYSCVDSDPATWAQDAQSGGKGFCRVLGVPLTTYTYSSDRPNMDFVLGGSTLTGIAKCGTIVLPAATVELLSGTSVVATTIAGEGGGFTFRGLASGVTFGLRYTSADGTVVCGAQATTTPGGSSVPDNTVPNLHNSTWLTAYPLQYDGSAAFPVQDYIATPRDAWFKFSIAPSEQVIVSLRDCQFDCSLVLFTDIQQAADTLQSGTLAALQQTQRAIAPAELSPAELSPAELSPAELSPAELSPAELSPAELSPAELSPAELSPAELSPAELSPAELSAAAYSSAQTASLLAISAHAGLSPELIVRNTWEHTGSFYVRVLSHDGATSQQPFTISARALPGACANVPLAPIASALAAGIGAATTSTLYLTNSSRLVDAPATATAPAMTVAQFMTRLRAFAALHGGTVVDFANDAGVTAGLAILDAHTGCALAANTVADTINGVVRAYRANGGLRYIVIAGGDRAIPFRRVPDLSGLGTEDAYHVPVLDSSVSNAALKSRFFLSQDFYAAPFPIVRGNLRVYLPQEGIGRLVESPRDMATMLDAFDSVNGMTAPKRALSTGYDFIADLAGDLKSTFATEGFTAVDGLIEATGLKPSDPTAWTADDLRAKLFGSTSYDVYAINGHFAGNLALAADYKTLIGSEEVANLPASDLRFRNALILSMGCHAGYSIVDQDAIPNLTQPVAWAEAFNGRGATVVGGTGYGYADTDFIQYSEKILSNTAKALGIGAGPVAIGDALVSAKAAYLSALAAPEGIDVKAASEATLYGLPMMRYDVLRPGSASGTTPLSLASGDSTGLQYGTPVLSYALNPHTQTGVPVSGSSTTADLTYYDASGDIQVTPLQPILPRNVTRLAVPATTVLRGGALVSARYTEVSPILPRTDVAVIEQRGQLPTAFASVYTPLRLFSLNQIGDGPSLVVLPLQYLTDGVTGTARLYDAAHLNIRLYTSSRTDAAALADAPAITSVVLTRTPTGVHVDARVGGLIAAGLEDVLFTYTTGPDPTTHVGGWTSATLRGGDLTVDRRLETGAGYSEHVSGDISTGSPDYVRLFVQAVSGNALVSVASNTGAYYRLLPDTTATPQAPKHQSALAFTSAPPSTVTYGSTVSATIRLTDGGTGVDGKVVDFNFGGHHVRAVTSGGGLATAHFVASFAPAGSPYLFTAAFKEDPTLLGSSLAPEVTITPAPTALVAAPVTAQYSDGAILAATLTGNGAGLTSELVTATIASGAIVIAQRATVTDGSGIARFDVRSFGPFAPGAYTATLAYGGNGSFSASSATVAFIRTAEDATIALTPPDPQRAGAVLVTATVTQAADGAPGDLTHAIAELTFQPNVGAATTVNAPVAADGSVSVTTTLPAGVYTVTAAVGGWFTSGLATATATLPVYDPTRFVTGGGWVMTTAGSTGLPAGRRVTFGFNARYPADRRTGDTGDRGEHTGDRGEHHGDPAGTLRPTGHLELQAKATDLELESETFDWLVIAGGRAELQGTASIDDSSAVWRFRLVAIDGSPDAFELSVWDAAGSLAHPRYHIGPAVLGGGSIRVH
ncbi:MAG TPA: carboxypeptidase regulatory-like domain-containing protein [Candidatus Limnocylindria bacterium]|nr:carboxypeptidase regulatory-like domain-containing protein [Candidatus Limnocylindria bacterium]